MIQLHKFFPQWGLYDPSQFCMKAAILLQMAGQEFQEKIEMEPGSAPKKKLPFITDNDEIVPDTSLIRKHLEQTYHIDFDENLDAEQRAQSYFLAKTIDEYGYWINVRMRWNEDENWPNFRDALFGQIPEPMRTTIADQSRESVQTTLYGQGISRYTLDELELLIKDLLQAVEAKLDTQRFAFANTPTSADASLYPFLISAAVPPIKNSAKDYILQSDRLKTYCNEMGEIYFPTHPAL